MEEVVNNFVAETAPGMAIAGVSLYIFYRILLRITDGLGARLDRLADTIAESDKRADARSAEMHSKIERLFSEVNTNSERLADLKLAAHDAHQGYTHLAEVLASLTGWLRKNGNN